ncbi:MAG: cell division protein FtsQ/DivIB [Pseudomonadales bacterium]
MLRWRRQDLAAAPKAEKPRGAQKIASAAPLSGSVTEWPVRSAMIVTAFALFCGLLYSGAKAAYQQLDPPISQISVSGSTQYLDTQSMVAKLVAGISAATLSQDLTQIEVLALEEPWVNGVSVRREWPGGLHVQIKEQIPVARWGEKGLLNHQGDIFWPQQLTSFQMLPMLSGPSTDTARVMQQYYTLNQFFKSLDSAMVGLTLQARGAWTVKLDNQVEVELGRENVLARLKRFLQLYRGHLYHEAERIEKVDVRYTNGVAVKWRPEREEQIVEAEQ